MRFRIKFHMLAILSCAVVVSTADSKELKHPDWHPNGNLIIAEGSCAGGIDLYLIDLESRRVRLVWNGEMTDGYPRWFPDGTRIVFHQIDENKNSKIFVANLSGNGHFSAETSITNGPFDIEPSPSPDGTKIAYSQRGDNGQNIVVLDLLNRGANKVWKTKQSSNFPSWHPNGSSIIFHTKASSGTHIYQRELESDRLAAVTTSEGPNFVGHFSSQGDRLAYSSERDGDREIYLHDFVTGTDKRLTNRPGRDGYPKISPDGQRLAYHRVISAASTTIRVIDLQGGEIAEFSCDDLVQIGQI